MKKSLIASVLIAALVCGFIFGLLVFNVPVGLGAFLLVNGLIISSLALARKVYSSRIKSKEANEYSYRELGFKGQGTFRDWVGSYRKVGYLPLIVAAWFSVMSFSFLYRLEDYSHTFATLIYFFGFPFLLLFLFFPMLPKLMNILTYFVFYLKGFILGFVNIFSFIGRSFKSVLPSKGNKVVLKIIIGILLAFFITFFFATLLASADPVFNYYIETYLEKTWEVLREIFIDGRIVVAVVTTAILGGGFYMFIKTKMSDLVELKKDKIKKQLEPIYDKVYQASDSIINIFVLGALNLVFAFFVLVQFKYLFANNLSTILGEFSYAEYARRGFTELLVVTVLAYPVLVFMARRTFYKKKTFNWLNIILIILLTSALFVVLYSAYYRLGLYQETYGFSMRRIGVGMGLVAVAAVLVGFVLVLAGKVGLNIKRKVRYLGLGEYALLPLIGMVILLTVIIMWPIPRTVVSKNMEFYYQTGRLDTVYMFNGAEETLPDLNRLYNELNQSGNSTDLQLSLQSLIYHKGQAMTEKRDRSLLTKVGSYNFTRERIIQESNNVSQLDSDEISRQLADSLLDGYSTALAAQYWEAALAYWDPTYSPNDIDELKKCVTVKSIMVSPDKGDNYNSNYPEIIPDADGLTQSYDRGEVKMQYQIDLECSKDSSLVSRFYDATANKIVSYSSKIDGSEKCYFQYNTKFNYMLSSYSNTLPIDGWCSYTTVDSKKRIYSIKMRDWTTAQQSVQYNSTTKKFIDPNTGKALSNVKVLDKAEVTTMLEESKQNSCVYSDLTIGWRNDRLVIKADQYLPLASSQEEECQEGYSGKCTTYGDFSRSRFTQLVTDEEPYQNSVEKALELLLDPYTYDRCD